MLFGQTGWFFFKYHFWFLFVLFFSCWALECQQWMVAWLPKATGQSSVKIYQYRYFCFICHFKVLQLYATSFFSIAASKFSRKSHSFHKLSRLSCQKLISSLCNICNVECSDWSRWLRPMIINNYLVVA